jgi:hypothetical protein
MEAKPSVRFRKLRIAWSVTWGIAAVLLFVLWVRSYSYVERALCTVNETFVYVASLPGSLGVAVIPEESVDPWIIYRQPTDEWLKSGQRGWLDRGWGGFYFDYVDEPTCAAPYWFWLLIPLTLSVAPWLSHWKQVSFSLRSLLIAMALVAAGLGLIVWASRK